MSMKLIWCYQKSYDIIQNETIKPYLYNLILEPFPAVIPFPRTRPLPVALAWGSDILQRENYGSEMLYRRGRRLLYRENFPQFAATSCRGEGELLNSSKRRMLYFLADLIVLSIVGALLSCFVCLIYRWLRKMASLQSTCSVHCRGEEYIASLSIKIFPKDRHMSLSICYLLFAKHEGKARREILRSRGVSSE